MLPGQSSKLAKLGRLERGRDSEMTLSSVDVKVAESGVKGRQIIAFPAHFLA
jgi:hypothetical protein